MFETVVDPGVIDGLREVGVCTIVDVLDHQFGLRSWLSHEITPLFKARIAGRAVTLLEEPSAGASPDEVAGFLDAADRCGPGTILVATMGGDRTLSITGDLVVAALHERGCAGAVLDGAVRDTAAMIALGFPVFAAAISPVDKTGKARTVGYNVPITCGGARVNPGDVIIADWDGVVVVPPALAAEVLDRARALVETEQRIAQAIRVQAKHKRLAEIFARFDG